MGEDRETAKEIKMQDARFRIQDEVHIMNRV